MKYTHIIWDFNGTILDDMGACIKSVNTLLSDRGLPIIESTDAYRGVFGFPIIDYYRRLGFDFDKEPYSVIAPIWVEQYLINVKDSPLFPDVKETFEAFKDMGLSQLVLSATELSMLRGQLSDLGIIDFFDDILGLDNIHAESKVALGKAWLLANPDAIPVLIGDTVHDAEVASEIGADCILVARGHQSRKTLEGEGVAVADDLSEAIELIKNS